MRVTVPGNVQVGAFFGHALIDVAGSDKDKHSSRVMLNTSVRF
jgi:hypothetical protein